MRRASSRLVTDPLAKTVDEVPDRIDREGCGMEVGRRRRQMDRSQLVQTHHVVGDDHLGGDLGEPGAGLGHRRLDVGHLALDVRVDLAAVGGSTWHVVFVTHLR